MSDRKGQSKWYDPNFDYHELEKYNKQLKKTRQQTKSNQTEVRMIVPMSVQCLICNEYIYKGTKFNSKKETVEGEDYCGIKIYRFYFKCPNCKNIFTIKTDPQHHCYVCEKNVKSNVDPRREELQRRENEMKMKKEEEENDIIKKMENQTRNAQREMKELERIDELKQMIRKNDSLSIDELIELRKQQNEMKNSKTDEKEIQINEIKEIKDIKIEEHTERDSRKRTFNEMKQKDQTKDIDKSKKKKKFSFL